MSYLRKPVQGTFAVDIPAGQTKVVQLSTSLDSPNDSEFWEVGLVTAQITMPPVQGQNLNFVRDTVILAGADLRVGIHSGGFYYVEEDLAGGWNGSDAFQMIANLSTPFVITPSERISVDLSLISRETWPNGVATPGPAYPSLSGTFNALLAGTIEQGD